MYGGCIDRGTAVPNASTDTAALDINACHSIPLQERLKDKVPILKSEIMTFWDELSIEHCNLTMPIDRFVLSSDVVFQHIDADGVSQSGIFNTVLALESRRDQLDKQVSRLKQTVHLLFPSIVSLWDELDIDTSERNGVCKVVMGAPYSHDGVDSFLVDLASRTTRFPLRAIEAVCSVVAQDRL
jgi:hypothetical protein